MIRGHSTAMIRIGQTRSAQARTRAGPALVEDPVRGLEGDEPHQIREQAVTVGRTDNRIDGTGTQIGAEIGGRGDGDRRHAVKRPRDQKHQQADREHQAGDRQPDPEAGNRAVRYRDQQADSRAGECKHACGDQAIARNAATLCIESPG